MKTKLILFGIATTLLIYGCGQFQPSDEEDNNRTKVVTGADGADAEPCTVTEFDDGAIITCPDGSEVQIHHGEKGEKGLNNSLPIYVGYFCSRTVIKIGRTNYVVHGNLVPLSSKWLKISTTCQIRVKKNVVETK